MGMVLNAVMSSLGSVNGLRILDLYAGTGTYGLRALELGAVRADFVERSTKFCDKLRENLRSVAGSPLPRFGGGVSAG